MSEQAAGIARHARLPVWRRLGWRLTASLLLLTALGILLSGFLQYRAQDRLLRQSLGSLLLNIARTGALLVDGDLHQAVVDGGRKDAPGYAAIRAQLTKIQETNQLKDPVYTLVDVRGDMSRFAVISMWDVPLGEPYRLVPDIQPILHRVLKDGAAAYTDIYRNEHGTWITAFAPVKNAAGRTVAALDVDFRADVYLAELAAVRRRLYFHSLAAAVLALGAGILLARHITRPLAQLASVARGVVEGDLTSRVHVSARDEIGMLGNVFYLMVERLRVSYRSLTDVVVRALEARGGESGALSRVAKAAMAVADKLDLSPTQREALELGALLHDVGETRTPEAILQKPGPLTAEERRILEQHPAAGVDILEAVPLLTPALDVVGCHHERHDGAGYPRGLRGEEIPFTARIFAVVDSLEAMTHDRPYRAARPVAEALEEIRRESGKQFDPRVVEAVLGIPQEQWATLLGCVAAGEPARVA
ncbi:MAG TPA: HD domain-containing phosphohydrolase [Candidatus Methylomirabilis sp.]|nr:HD domain-containing phosphohydrolase [Candidatus Methylomirabilis sp.]